MCSALNAPVVSVFMPTKDRLLQLQSAVQSVLAQTYSAFELIIVNDGSSDSTADYLNELCTLDSRVRVVHHVKPAGAPACRNQALRLARGIWATGLDDDDEFKPGRLEAFVTYATMLERHHVSFSALYSQDEVIEPQGRRLTRKESCVHFENLLMHNCIGNQIFARREVFLEIGLYDEKLPAWQDLDLNMRIVSTFGPALLVDAPYYVFYNDERPDRISRKRKTLILDAYWCISKKWPQLSDRARQTLYLQTLSSYYGFPISAQDVSTYFKLSIKPSSIVRLGHLLIERFRVTSAARCRRRTLKQG